MSLSHKNPASGRRSPPDVRAQAPASHAAIGSSPSSRPEDRPASANPRTSTPDLLERLDRLLAVTTAGLWDTERNAFARILDGTAPRGLYAYYLVQTYHYIRWTKATLSKAGRCLAQDVARGRGGPLHVALAARFERHASEEDGHERWALNDLRSIGMDAEVLGPIPACRAVRAFNAYSDFAAQSAFPTAILGEAFVLESLSSDLAGTAAENLRARSGIPGIDDGVTFLVGHAHADESHVEELRVVLSRIDDAAEQEAIYACATMAAQCFLNIVAEYSPP